MLTGEAYENRKWEPFPALRRALQGRLLPDEYYGGSSVADTDFEALPRLFEIALLARHHPEAIRNEARVSGWSAMHDDVDRLSRMLKELGHRLREAAGDVEKLHELLRGPQAVPIPDSYWLIDGLLLAGEYPGTPSDHTTREKLAKFLDAGIRTFIDLTEADEHLTKYDLVLRELAAERGIETKHLRYGIRDLGVPGDRGQMRRILETIREEVTAGRPTYVHCWGGVGRTGTVIGCWLVEQGITGPAAIERIATLRAHTPDGHKRSPETDEQRRYICEWKGTEC